MRVGEDGEVSGRILPDITHIILDNQVQRHNLSASEVLGDEGWRVREIGANS